MQEILIDTENLVLLKKKNCKGNDYYELAIFINNHFDTGFTFEINNNQIENICEE